MYPGPTIEAQRGTPTTVRYENQLPAAHLLPLDTSIVPEGDATVRALTHLHSGFVSAFAHPTASQRPEGSGSSRPWSLLGSSAYAPRNAEVLA